MKSNLRKSEQNILVNALMEGRSWEEAKKALPGGIDSIAINKFRKDLTAEAEARKAAEARGVGPVPVSAEAVAHLSQQVEALQKEIKELGESNVKLAGMLREAQDQLAQKERDIASLINGEDDSKATKGKSAK
jgi:hypothetical protein